MNGRRIVEEFQEESIILISILKWFVLATAVGLLVGTCTTLFLKAIHWSSTGAQQYQYYYLSLPLVLFVSILLVKYLAPDARGHGTEKVIESIHKSGGHIKPFVIPVKLLATLLTLAGGGSVGKEGPSAQIGAGLSSALAGSLRLSPRDRKKLVICGVSAGFASVFGTPIAGAIFGVEILFVGTLLYDMLLPSLIAGITGYQVTQALELEHFYHQLPITFDFSSPFFLSVMLAGIFAGLCSFLLIEMFYFVEAIASGIKVWEPIKGLIGGAILCVLTLLIGSDRYLGLGLDTIDATLSGSPVNAWDVPMKALFTFVTLAFGGSGGIVTPLLFLGATSGALFGQVLGLDTAIFAAIGLVGVLAGCTSAPIATSIMAIELFGPDIAPYAAFAATVSFVMTGHRSVYPSQILAVKKSQSISVVLGSEIEEAHPHFHLRGHSFIYLLLRLTRVLKRRLQRRWKRS